jgi:predicted metalloprotease with PDZ domain
VDETRDAARDTARDARDTARDARDAARDTTRDARDAARDTARDARDTARDARDRARDLVDDARGSARRTFRTEDLRGPDLGLWFERSTRDGLVIADLATEGAIADLGFREGDRIVSVNGRRVASEREFITLLSDDELRDQRVKVAVMRGGRQEVIQVQPSALLEPATTVSTSRLEDFGIILDDRIDNRVVVWRVVPRSPAFYAGIRPRDVILSFGGERIAAGPDLVRVIEKADPGEVAIQVNRGDRTRTIQAEMTAMEARTAARPIPDTPGEVRRETRRDLREDRALDRQDRLRRRANPFNR